MALMIVIFTIYYLLLLSAATEQTRPKMQSKLLAGWLLHAVCQFLFFVHPRKYYNGDQNGIERIPKKKDTRQLDVESMGFANNENGKLHTDCDGALHTHTHEYLQVPSTAIKLTALIHQLSKNRNK
jgi:hypothetical protein